MMKSENLIIVAVIILFLLGNHDSEAKYFDSLILKDLKGVKVNISVNEDTANLVGIDIDKFKEKIELKLVNLGINLYKEDTTEFYMTGRPEVQIKIYPKYFKNENSINFLVETSFMLTVRSFTDSKVTIRVPITFWQDFKCNGNKKDIQDIAGQHINHFVNEICAPKVGGICKEK